MGVELAKRKLPLNLTSYSKSLIKLKQQLVYFSQIDADVNFSRQLLIEISWRAERRHEEKSLPSTEASVN